ncbi:O-antigen ligase family protein [Psychroserpens sp. XS_ASV72]|uniref:O-antigen ligase family protein n=1 Tax=Psychroserpens sp. XS_ASV72 TaxID=3241293 RepID=UPI003514FC42
MSASKNIKSKLNSIEFLMLLLGLSLSTLLLGFAASGIILGVFVAFGCRYTYLNKIKPRLHKGLIIPVLLYVFAVCSFLWSVDIEQTTKGMEKMVVIFVLPIVFMFLPEIKKKQSDIVFKVLTVSNTLLGVFFICNAIYNYINTKSLMVFTYHQLVEVLELNAIYVSLLFSMSLFYLISLQQKRKAHYVLMGFFAMLLFLLSSKTILAVILIGFIIYLFKMRFKNLNKRKVIIGFVMAFILVGISSITLAERLIFEKHSKLEEVLTQEKFGKIYYWTGSSIRLLQLRILKEQIEEEPILIKGFGLFASRDNVAKRHTEFDTYFKFHEYNYHNQYAQTLSELGLIGLCLLLAALVVIWSKAINTGDYLILMFAILMTSVFFTESILWRQRGLFLFIILYSLFLKRWLKQSPTQNLNASN